VGEVDDHSLCSWFRVSGFRFQGLVQDREFRGLITCSHQMCEVRDIIPQRRFVGPPPEFSGFMVYGLWFRVKHHERVSFRRATTCVFGVYNFGF